MRTIKTRETARGIKVLDKSVNLSKRMKDSFVRTKERAEETQSPRQASPTEYASDNIQSAAQGAAREIVHNPVNPRQRAADNWSRAKSHFQEARHNLPKERRAAAGQAQKTAIKARDGADKLQKAADKAGETAKGAKAAVKDAKQTLKQVRQDGRRTLREVRQSARAGPTRVANAPAGEIPRSNATAQAVEAPKPENPAKRDFIKNRARARAENTRLNGKTAAKPDNPTAGGIHVRSDSPIGDSRPGYMNGRIRPAKGAGDAVQAAPKTGKTAKSTAKTAKQTARGTIKTAKKSIKTAEKSARAAVKTARQTAKAAQKSAQTAAKAAKIAERTARSAAKVAVRTAKAATRAAVAMVKAAVAAVKGLVAAIAAGGWVAVLVILIICLIGLLVGSVFGIFFSGEPGGGDGGNGGKTINGVIAEVDSEYTAQIDGIISGNAHDLLDMSGARAAWKQVLAVYTVRTVSDPANPMDVATIDDAKAAILRSVFWEMNSIDHSLDTVEVVEDVLDEDGEPTGGTVAVTKTVLRVAVAHKTTDEMAAQYGFSDEQKDWLTEILKPDYHNLWNALLYGISSVGDGSMISAAETQLGNIGGEPYWSWYGFSSRVEWCACFVSWCAKQCGFIDADIIPKFSSCETGIGWFKAHECWQERGDTPAPGDIIFFDWEGDGISDHVGIVERADTTTVYTIEGNTSDSVARRSYAADSVKIMGYGVPDYNPTP